MKRTPSLVALFLAMLTLTAYAADDQGKTGKVTAVDAAAKTFTVELNPRPLTFTVDDKTIFTFDGKASTFEEALKVGNRATVTYTKSGETRLASKVDAKTPPPPKKG